MSSRPRTREAAVAGAPYRVGLLGHGTVGGGVRGAAGRARRRDRALQRPPAGDHRGAHALAGRLRGDPRAVRPDRRADGRHRARARATCWPRCRAGRDVVSANKQLLSQHGEELFETAREHGVRLRFEAAVAGAVPVVRVLEESLSATPIDRIHGIVNGTTNFILTEMTAGSTYPEALAEAQRRGLRRGRPERRRQRPRRGGEDGDPRAARVRHAGAPRRGPLRGHRAPARRRHGVRARARARAEAGRHRRAPCTAGSRYACTPRSSTPGIRWPRSSGPFNAVTVESGTITEITMSGPGAGGPQTASAVLGDVVSVMTGGARPPAPPLPLTLDRATSRAPSTCTSTSPTSPACSPR